MREGMGRGGSSLIFLGLLSVIARTAVGATSSIHTVISTQCTEDIYFEWQAIGLAYSFKRAGQPGPLTRLLSCTDEKLKAYKWLDIVPTFVVPDVEFDEEHQDHYTAYNKPFAVSAWLRVVKPREEYVMVIDADCILRKPFIPEELHLELGQAHTPYHFEVMTGVSGELAERHVPFVKPRMDWLAGPEGRKADRVGPPYIMHREDMETVAPLWYHFTKEVRNDPGAWNLTGDGSVHRPGEKSWISEMYGYAFAAATADVWHQQVDYSANLVPGYGPIGPPKVLHYGNELAVNNITYYDFNKIELKANKFNPLDCPPWTKKDGKFTSGLLPFPPSPLSFESKGLDLLRDLLAIEPAVVLNAAFCERHLKGCPQHEHLKACDKVAKQEQELDEAFDALQEDLRKVPCKNWHRECDEWGAGNFCNSNPRFMWYACRKTCGTCFKPDLEVRWHGGLNASMMAAAKAKSHCHEVRQEQLLAGEYELDYSSEGLGEAEDPCEEAVKQAKQIALLEAVEEKETLQAEVKAKAKAVAQQPAGGAAVAAAAAGTGEVQKRPEGWVLPHETLPAEVVVHLKNPMPLSKRLRANFTSGATAVRAPPAVTAAPAAVAHEAAPAVRVAPEIRAALRLRSAPHGASTRSVHAFILFLDWFGVVAMWGCAVGVVLLCLRRPLSRSLSRGKSGPQGLPVKHT